MVLLKDLNWEIYCGSDDWMVAWVKPERSIYKCMINGHPTTPAGHYWVMGTGVSRGMIIDPIEAQCLINQWLTEEGNDEAQ